jgi:hypothetical protein
MVMVRLWRDAARPETTEVTGVDVSEYERHRQRPSTSRPIPMY